MENFGQIMPRECETMFPPTAVIARLDRATQYSRDAEFESRSRGVLGRPVEPGDDRGAWRCILILILPAVA